GGGWGGGGGGGGGGACLGSPATAARGGQGARGSRARAPRHLGRARSRCGTHRLALRLPHHDRLGATPACRRGRARRSRVRRGLRAACRRCPTAPPRVTHPL